jgi:hypothetical protein
VKIELSVDGGLASFPGLRRPVTLECDRLPADRRARLAQLVEQARFFSAAAPASAPASPDCRTYTVAIEDGSRARTLKLVEPIGDAALRELVDEIRDCARALRA